MTDETQKKGGGIGSTIGIFIILGIFEIFLVLLLLANWITGILAVIGWFFFVLILFSGIGLFIYWYIKNYKPDLLQNKKYILSTPQSREIAHWILKEVYLIYSDFTKTSDYEEEPIMAGEDELTPLYHLKVRDKNSSNIYHILMITDDLHKYKMFSKFPKFYAVLKNPSNYKVKECIRNLTRKREKEDIVTREVRDEYGNVRARETTTSRIPKYEQPKEQEKAVVD